MVQIKLPNGSIISNPEERIRDYCKVEIYSGYDDCHDVNKSITKLNIRSANRLFARISSKVAESIMQSSENRNYLSEIENKELGEISEDEWKEIKEKLFNLFVSSCSIKGVGIAVATKILHLKRPKLIPILDSFVIKFLLGISTENMTKQQQVKIALMAIDVIRKDIIDNRDSFIYLKQNLSDLLILLETVRLYDILVWSTEKWDIRGDLTAPYGKPKTTLGSISTRINSQSQHDVKSTNKKEIGEPVFREIITLDIFNEIKFKENGYIVITDTANPNKIHKPQCQFLLEGYFKVKVVENNCKNGHYYWTDDLQFAKEKWGALPCKRCCKQNKRKS